MSVKVKTIELTVTVTLEAHEVVSAVESRINAAIADIGESCDMICGECVVTSEREHRLEDIL